MYGELYYLFQSDCFVAMLGLVSCIQASPFQRDEFQRNGPSKSILRMQLQTPQEWIEFLDPALADLGKGDTG